MFQVGGGVMGGQVELVFLASFQTGFDQQFFELSMCFGFVACLKDISSLLII
jgi:hypothetical protein